MSTTHYNKVPEGTATNNTVDMETEPSEILFKNGSDHAVVASYSELYEEGEVEHINGPSHPPIITKFGWYCETVVTIKGMVMT